MGAVSDCIPLYDQSPNLHVYLLHVQEWSPKAAYISTWQPHISLGHRSPSHTLWPQQPLTHTLPPALRCLVKAAQSARVTLLLCSKIYLAERTCDYEKASWRALTKGVYHRQLETSVRAVLVLWPWLPPRHFYESIPHFKSFNIQNQIHDFALEVGYSS